MIKKEFKQLGVGAKVLKEGADANKPEFDNIPFPNGFVSIGNPHIDFTNGKVVLPVEYYIDPKQGQATISRNINIDMSGKAIALLQGLRGDLIDDAFDILFPETKGKPWEDKDKLNGGKSEGG